MAPCRNRYLLLNYVFCGFLLLLVLNDHVLKPALGNWWTGKLSDAAGIILLPLLLGFLFPRLQRHVLWISALFFVWWKSPLSTGFIQWYNTWAAINITRVIDYTDLWVLLLLPVSHYVIHRVNASHALAIHRVHPAFILLPAMFAFMATSPPYYYRYQRTGGNLYCLNCYVNIKLTQEEIVHKLAEAQIVFDSVMKLSDTVFTGVDTAHAPAKLYKINELVIDGDTLRNVDLTMVDRRPGKTRIYFTGMQVKEDLSEMYVMIKLRKLNRRKIFRELRDKLE